MSNRKKTRPRGFAPWNPRSTSLLIIEQVKLVLKEYKSVLPMTIRQIFYRMVAQHDYPKTESAYESLGEKLNRARRAQLIPFSAIRDDGFYQTQIYPVLDAEDAIDGYRNMAGREVLDRQHDQERPLSVWCEARGMAPMLESVTLKYGIPVLSSGGFDSATTQHAMGKDLATTEGLVLHLGDYDPSGVHMFTSLEENIVSFADAYGGLPELERVAIVPDQINRYDLPTAPPKKTDNRAFGDHRTVQLEAFAPDVLLTMLESEIQSRMDLAMYEQVLAEEREMREEILLRLSAGGPVA